MWDQFASCDPTWPSPEAGKEYADLRDRQRAWHLLMTLRDEFESIQSYLLYRSALPKLDTVIKDLISDEARLDTFYLRKLHLLLMWFLLPRYLLNLLLMLRPHLVPLLRIYLDQLERTFVITVKSMVILSLSVANYSLSNLLAKALYSNQLVLLLLLLLKVFRKYPS